MMAMRCVGLIDELLWERETERRQKREVEGGRRGGEERESQRERERERESQRERVREREKARARASEGERRYMFWKMANKHTWQPRPRKRPKLALQALLVLLSKLSIRFCCDASFA